MLRTLFPRAYRDYQRSSCSGELEAFAGWLQSIGYSRYRIRGHVRRLRRTLEGGRCARGVQRYKDRDLSQLFGAAAGPMSADAVATKRLFLRFLSADGRLQSAPVQRNRRQALMDSYHSYLIDVRGFTASTARQHLTTVADFLHHALGVRRSLRTVASRDVESYVRRRACDVRRESLQHIIAHLRGFFRYGAARRFVRRHLDIIDTPRTYRGERPPRALAWPTVQQLLRSIDRAGKAGWRDYAMLHLMAHYGLRPSEVVALDLDAIDWAGQTLQVDQRETRSKLRLPLLPRTLTILRRYLAVGRPVSSDKHLFLRVRDPAGPLRHTAICDVFAKRASQIGIPLERYSSYSLRHGFAVRLLQRGVGIKAIGDVLGHRSFESTQVYLRLDTDMLRTVALPVPRSSAARRHA